MSAGEADNSLARTRRIKTAFVRTIGALIDITAAASEARLAEITNDRGDTLVGRIIHGLHDEARHQGEMYLLLKLCNRPSE